MTERIRECTELQDGITARRREELIGSTIEVLVDAPGEARSYREAPEIDGIVTVPDHLPVGAFVEVVVTDADGPDLIGRTAPATVDGPAPLAAGRDGRAMSDGTIGSGIPARRCARGTRHHVRALGPAHPGQRHHRASGCWPPRW